MTDLLLLSPGLDPCPAADAGRARPGSSRQVVGAIEQLADDFRNVEARPKAFALAFVDVGIHFFSPEGAHPDDGRERDDHCGYPAERAGQRAVRFGLVDRGPCRRIDPTHEECEKVPRLKSLNRVSDVLADRHEDTL